MSLVSVVAAEKVVPTRVCEMAGGAVRVCMFGCPIDYTRILKNPEGKKIIAGQARDLGVRKIFAPRATEANALVIDANPELFPEREVVDGVEIFYGACVDGVRLTASKTAFFIASADCQTLVARFADETVVAAHCALNSLIDPATYGKERGPNRAQGSVVDGIFSDNQFSQNSMTAAGLFCGIGPNEFEYRFTDPVHGATNQKLINLIIARWGEETVLNADTPGRMMGQINICEVVKSQMRRYGVPVDHGKFVCDGVDTYTDMTTDDDTGRSTWWSHRRWWDTGSRGIDGRNGVLVIRMT